MAVPAQEELVKFGNFDSWLTRTIRESILVGGKTRTLYEVGPRGTYNGARAYTNQGGSPWGNSNVYAKVAGVVKTNVSVYPDTHKSGQCAKLSTHIVKCKAIGIVNISVLATGSLFLGSLLEPVTEEGWAGPDETPTQIILKFDSSHGGPFVGTVGNTLWVDNVKLVY